MLYDVIFEDDGLVTVEAEDSLKAFVAVARPGKPDPKTPPPWGAGWKWGSAHIRPHGQDGPWELWMAGWSGIHMLGTTLPEFVKAD